MGDVGGGRLFYYAFVADAQGTGFITAHEAKFSALHEGCLCQGGAHEPVIWVGIDADAFNVSFGGEVAYAIKQYTHDSSSTKFRRDGAAMDGGVRAARQPCAAFELAICRLLFKCDRANRADGIAFRQHVTDAVFDIRNE